MESSPRRFYDCGVATWYGFRPERVIINHHVNLRYRHPGSPLAEVLHLEGLG
jgi:hypothetical protein